MKAANVMRTNSPITRIIAYLGMSRFNTAIVKRPGENYSQALTSVELGAPDLVELEKQHAAYVQVLVECGLRVEVLDADHLPDSVFVEDAAICVNDLAIITRPGADSRKHEVPDIDQALSGLFARKAYIEAPGTVDGGDILETESAVYIGLSARTNQEGARQLQNILEAEGVHAVTTEFPEFLHLKSGVSYLGNNVLLLAPSFEHLEVFNGFQKIVTSAEEAYCANAVLVNDVVLVPAGYPVVLSQLQQAGYRCAPLQMSEFEKKDGGLSCLSLRFSTSENQNSFVK